jgi:hypothetical protein
MKWIIATENYYGWISLRVYIDTIGKHLVERNKKKLINSPDQIGFSQPEQLFEHDEATFANTDERSLYIHTASQNKLEYLKQPKSMYKSTPTF